MLRRLFFLSAILVLAFTVTAIGQNNKRTLSKPKRVQQAKNGVREYTDIQARKKNKRKPNPKPFIGSPTDGNGIRKPPTKRAKIKHQASPIIILDQDTQTVVGKRKRKNH